MTTLKPQLVRADTLDLQAHEGPSAKDHTRQPAHGDPYGYGPAAPHQAQTLRHAEHEAYRQQHTSPRASEEDQHGPFSDSQRFYDDPEDEVDDEHMHHLHGTNGATDHDRDYEDADTSDSHDEDMDDDLMDKISSSPSIEDGKYSLPPWPPRMDSVDRGASPAPLSTPTRGDSCSPFICPPVHFPIPNPQEEDHYSASHHFEEPGKRHGIYNMGHSPYRSASYAASSSSLLPSYSAPFQEDYRNDLDAAEVANYLLPIDDPLLDDTFNQLDEGFYDDDDDDDDGVWEDEDINIPDYESSSDDSEDVLLTNDSRFIDSGWGGECLREIEDIDFEFVYALHTFVATVEGQANATKGDTMVLLDDSNSYWWLVRVVKDGSIGYLPAEHIETPTERLARLNKHRNIDLSASMLGDNPEKSKNPLKKAMRRRNAKTVQFAPPTYYEPSDAEYSDEEDGDVSQLERAEAGTKAEEPAQEQAEQADRADTQGHVNQIMGPTNGIKRIASNESLDEEPSSPVKDLTPEPLQPSVQHSDSVSRSRNGVVRNTDSFFKDDSAETKKISLTPRLLRGDSGPTASNDQDMRQRPSMETFDQLLADNEKPKEQSQQPQQQQPKKEKKGMLSGLFKRKDKAPKNGKSDSDRPDKTSEESLRHSPQSKDSLESLTKVDQAPERKPSKLQKQPPTYTSPTSSPTEARPPQRDMQPVQVNAPPAPSGPAPAPPTVRPVEQSEPEQQRLAPQPQAQASSQTPNRFPSLQEKRSIFSPITDALKPSPSSSDTGEAPIKSVVSKRAKERFAIDTSDSEDEATPTAEPQLHGKRSVSPLNEVQSSHRRNDSGMQISPIEPSLDHDSVFETATKNAPKTEHIAIPSEEEPEAVREVTPTDLEHTASTSKASPSTVTTHTPSTSRSTPTWSDASLRNYMDNDQDIKDLLIIVHDKSNVTPVGPDHPLMANLFSTERTKLTDMQGQLDTMLMSWMSRKNSNLLSR